MATEKKETTKAETKKTIELSAAYLLEEARGKAYSADIPTAALTAIKPQKNTAVILLHTSFFSRLDAAKKKMGKDKNISTTLSWDYIQPDMIQAYNGDLKAMLHAIHSKDKAERKNNKEAKERLSDTFLFLTAEEYSKLKKNISYSEYSREFKTA